MSGIFGDVGTWVVTVIDAFGYVGLALVVALENIFPPIPSELVLPLAGFLAAQGRMTIVGAVVAATVGSLLGALVLYWIGYALGPDRSHALVKKYGRWVMISEDDLDKAQSWFDNHGRSAVFFGRLAPLVRSLISLPAGVARMSIVPFVIYTTLGSGLWNGVLIGGGWLLGDNWELVSGYQKYFGYAVVAILVGLILWLFGKRLLHGRVASQGPHPPAPSP